MTKTELTEFIDSIVMDRFIMRFVPGLILYFGINELIAINAGSGLTSFLIIASLSWTYGLILEVLLFAKPSTFRITDPDLYQQIRTDLFLGKVGISAVFSIIAGLFAVMVNTELFDEATSSEEEWLGKAIFLVGVVFVFGLYLFFRSRNRIR